MYDYKSVIDLLGGYDYMNRKKRRKILTELFFDEDFIKWLFQPENFKNIASVISEMYSYLIRPEWMQAMCEMIDMEGYESFNRSHAVFFAAIRNIATEDSNERHKALDRGLRDRTFGKREQMLELDFINRRNRYIKKLHKRLLRIVKRQARRLARESRLPEYITTAALTIVPEPKYVDKNKIAYYLGTTLNTIYSDVEENGDFSRNPKWETFFAEIFGDKAVVEVATCILVEGVDRIDHYRNSRDVKECWDSLTQFALEALDESSDQVRTQMIELYIKRIDKMFQNKTPDLRVDLTRVNMDMFPDLMRTVDKYRDRILDIIHKKS